MKISPERYLELTLCCAFMDAIRYCAGQMRQNKYKNPAIVYDNRRFKFAGSAAGRVIFPAEQIGALTHLSFGKICADGTTGRMAYYIARRNFSMALKLAGLNEPRNATDPVPLDPS